VCWKAKISVVDICGSIEFLILRLHLGSWSIQVIIYTHKWLPEWDFYPESCNLSFAAFVPYLLPFFWLMIAGAFAFKYPKFNIIGNPIAFLHASFIWNIVKLILCGTCHEGKEELQSFEGSCEASRSDKRTECEAADDECNEIHAALGSGPVSDSVTEDPNVRKPSTTSSSKQKW